MMKVAFVHDHRFKRISDKVYSESQYGSSVWKRYLMDFEEVVVLARDGYNDIDDDEESLILSSREKVTFVLFESLSSLKAQILDSDRIFHEIDSEVKKANAVVARLPSELGLLAIKSARSQGIPYAIEVVGCVWDALWNYGNLKAKLYAPLANRRMKHAVADAPFVLYVTDRFLQDRYPNSEGLSVGCSDVAIESPKKSILESRLRKIEAYYPQAAVLGLIGTMKTNYKGIDTVLKSLPNILSVYPNISFRVLGEGDSARWYNLAQKYKVENHVRFDGTISSREGVMQWLQNIDIYLQPSRQEGLPRALIEAMSMGCPAIGSSCAGIPELLDADLLIPPGDHTSLEQSILALLSSKDLMIEKAHRNWSFSSNYSSHVLDKKRSDFYLKFREACQER